jgi:hypothetical protein
VANGSADGFFHAEYPEESFKFLIEGRLASALYHSYYFSGESNHQEVTHVALDTIASLVLGVGDYRFHLEM